MPEVTFTVSGMQELDKNLRELADDIRDKMLMEAAREGATVIADQAKVLAPKERGAADPKSIVSRIKVSVKRPDRFGVVARIIAGAPHSHLLEFGTKAHKIVAKNKKALADAVAKKFFGKVVNHPGNSAKPFMRPAFESKKVEAVNRMADVLREKIAAYRAKNVKRAV